MLFTPTKVAFGRHETFALRYSWLTKGFEAVAKDPSIFTSDEATVTLGVGRNMVNAIRYWLQAAGLVEPADTGFQGTALGKKFFGQEGFDRYLEDEATIWLIHWQIASNPALATSWYWFFNRFHKPEFTSEEASTALLDFSKQNIPGKFSQATLRKDISVLLRMYARSERNTRLPLEETLDSPLSLLGLITRAPAGRTYSSRAMERTGLPIGILGFAVARLFREGKPGQAPVFQLPIDELMYARGNACAPGAVFRLTENAMMSQLEDLIHKMPGIFEIRETAGIHQLYLMGEKPIEPTQFLQFHYQGGSREDAA